MSGKRVPGEANRPYWLLHEPGCDHGFGTVDLEDAITAERAIEVWKELNPEWVEVFGPGFVYAARLVVLRYVNGKPDVATIVA